MTAVVTVVTVVTVETATKRESSVVKQNSTTRTGTISLGSWSRAGWREW